MTQAPMPMETTMGYAPPTVTQFSVFLVNKVGKLFDLARKFDTSSCKVCALSVHEASDHAVVRIITNQAAIARRMLIEDNLPFSERAVLVVELCKGHTLASMCMTLLSAELQIHFAYPMLHGPGHDATIALSCDDQTLAGQVLRRKEFRLFGEAELGNI
mgnify:CR=1 FL=1